MVFNIKEIFKHLKEEGSKRLNRLDGLDLKDISDKVVCCQQLLLKSKGWKQTSEGWYHPDVNCLTYVQKTLIGDREVVMPALTLAEAFEYLAVDFVGKEDVARLLLERETDILMTPAI